VVSLCGIWNPPLWQTVFVYHVWQTFSSSFFIPPSSSSFRSLDCDDLHCTVVGRKDILAQCIGLQHTIWPIAGDWIGEYQGVSTHRWACTLHLWGSNLLRDPQQV
jgi:hypothetical protein